MARIQIYARPNCAGFMISIANVYFIHVCANGNNEYQTLIKQFIMKVWKIYTRTNIAKKNKLFLPIVALIDMNLSLLLHTAVNRIIATTTLSVNINNVCMNN